MELERLALPLRETDGVLKPKWGPAASLSNEKRDIGVVHAYGTSFSLLSCLKTAAALSPSSRTVAEANLPSSSSHEGIGPAGMQSSWGMADSAAQLSVSFLVSWCPDREGTPTRLTHPPLFPSAASTSTLQASRPKVSARGTASSDTLLSNRLSKIVSVSHLLPSPFPALLSKLYSP